MDDDDNGEVPPAIPTAAGDSGRHAAAAHGLDPQCALALSVRVLARARWRSRAMSTSWLAGRLGLKRHCVLGAGPGARFQIGQTWATLGRQGVTLV